MFDPAAIGTLIIGLNADRAETASLRRHRAERASARRAIDIRLSLARGLRRVAALLDRPTVGEATN